MPPTISVSGNNLYQSGASVLPYAVASSGPTELARMSSTGSQADATRLAALEELLNASQDQQMRARYAGLGRTSITVNTALRTALDLANGGDIATLFPATPLSAQLRMIARLIQGQPGTVDRPQAADLLAGLGGFDTHDLQMDLSRHAALLTQVAQALAAFRAGLQEIGMLNRVTTFTMSDFGRTLNSNGNGTDHAWGGVQLVMGGAAANGGSCRPPGLGRLSAAGTGRRTVDGARADDPDHLDPAVRRDLRPLAGRGRCGDGDDLPRPGQFRRAAARLPGLSPLSGGG